MPTNVIMPQLGESVVEGTVGKWLKRAGERVAEFEPLLEVNTDKVDTEIPAPAAGVLLQVLVPEGATVKAGTVLALIGQPGEAPTAGRDEPVAHPLGQPLPARPNGGAQRPAPAVVDSPFAAAFWPSGAARAQRDLGFISPVVAQLAREHNLDLQQVPGTGQGGRITKRDVLAFLETQTVPPHPEGAEVLPAAEEAQPWEKPGEGDLFRPDELQPGAANPELATALPAAPPPAEPVAAPAAADDSIPVAGMRQRIAEHMLHSALTAPHVTTVFEADLSAVLAHQAAHAPEFARDGVTLTLTAYFVAAAVAALQAVPIVNSQWAEDRILLKREINVGLAVALDEGLIVPVIPRADEKSLLGLARAINDLARRARAKALQPDEVQGGTFTITNHGVSGSLLATPIIHQPQSAILGVGVMQKRVLVINDAIAIRPMVYLTLTFDHRVLDGAVADRFMGQLKSALEGWR